MKVLKIAISVALAASLASLVALNLSGFSYAHGRWLSDEEFLQIAANTAAARRLGNVIYASGEALITANPGCCHVLREGDQWSDESWRFLGWYIVIVRLRYRISSPGSPDEEKYYSHRMAIGASGRIYDETGTKIPGQES